ncbi:MAG: DUF72 domain-containing protein [Planctomycetia bacterium]
MAREIQRSLFADPPPESPLARPPQPEPVAPVVVAADIHALASRLPPRIHLGTSSWSFPGWTGLVYAPRDGKPESEQRLARGGLAAYARHPLFGSVSLDRTFYAPLLANEYAAYAAAVPDTFRFVVKAPAAITDPFKRGGNSGLVRGDNPTFLDATTAAAVCVAPAVAGLGAKLGAIVFQFPPLGRALLTDVPRLVARLVAFVAALPRPRTDGLPHGPAIALEIRDPALVCEALAAGLVDGGAIPCLAAHARMPPLETQAEVWRLDRFPLASPLVVRWNLHAGKEYEGAKQEYFPFDRLVEEDLQTRDALARLVRTEARSGRTVLVTINNKAEGSAPWSVCRLAEAIEGHS